MSTTIARRNEERRSRIAEAQVVNVIPNISVFTIIKIIAIIIKIIAIIINIIAIIIKIIAIIIKIISIIIVIFIQDIEVRVQGKGSTTRLQKDALLEEALVLDSV